MMIYKRNCFNFLSVLFLTLLVSCGVPVPDDYDPESRGKKKVVVKPSKLDPLRPSGRFFSKKNLYFYDPDNKRNPFKAYDISKANLANVIESPLEKYQLSELVLVGIIWGISDPRGMIKAPDDQTYVVRRRSRIGKNKGKVSRVLKSSIFIEEEYRDPTGNIAMKETELELQGKDSDSLSGGLKTDA